MMRWHRETDLTPDHTPVLVLRDRHGIPHALVMEDRNDSGYTAQIIERNLPSRSGFRHTFQAALWAQRYITRLRDPHATFDRDFPTLYPTTKKIRTGAKPHAHETHVGGRMDRHPR